MFELARCCWGSSFHLSEPVNFSECVQLPGSVPNDSFNRDGTPVAAQKFRSHVLGQICLDSGTTLKSTHDPFWNWASYMFWANWKMRKIVDCYIQQLRGPLCGDFANQKSGDFMGFPPIKNRDLMTIHARHENVLVISVSHGKSPVWYENYPIFRHIHLTTDWFTKKNTRKKKDTKIQLSGHQIGIWWGEDELSIRLRWTNTCKPRLWKSGDQRFNDNLKG